MKLIYAREYLSGCQVFCTHTSKWVGLEIRKEKTTKCYLMGEDENLAMRSNEKFSYPKIIAAGPQPVLIYYPTSCESGIQ